MFYSVIDAASLNNPTILNGFTHIDVSVHFEPKSPTSKYHYIFLLKFKDSEIHQQLTKVQKEMLYSWYSFFWNERILYIVFDKRKFEISLPGGWSSPEYKAAQEYGRTHGIPDAYLDYRQDFQPYAEIVSKLK